jgi:hypothetical protein
MSKPRMPEPEHIQFDEICARLDEHEPLPSVVARPAEASADQSDEERTAPLDELILAGLVAPY